MAISLSYTTPGVAESHEAATPLLGAAHRHRLQLLQLVDRLDTLLSIHHNAFSADAFAAFRDESLPTAAAVFAASGHVRAVELLFRRHPNTFTGNIRLAVLGSFAASLPPAGNHNTHNGNPVNGVGQGDERLAKQR